METTKTQKIVLDFIEKFSDSNAEVIASGTKVNKLLIFKTVKQLADKKLITISDTKPVTYRLLKQDGKTAKAEKKVADDEVFLKSGARNTDKLKFNGELYGKGRLCLAVVKKYMQDHPKTSLTKLKEIFPDTLSPRYGFIRSVEQARKMSSDRERFFLKPEDLVKVGDKKVAVCNQFGAHNLPLKHFRQLGFTIK